MTKKILSTFVALLTVVNIMAQGWPSDYGGVMLQGFYWNSYSDSHWTKLESQADELAKYFSLIWVPQSGKCLEANNMGYTPYYYFNQNSSFGTQDELKAMIATFKTKGLSTIADVVVNHHNTNGWFGFPAETYKGVTYQLTPADITANDDGGATAAQAKKQGVTLSMNNDEGDDWDGCRDLDHKSANVNKVVKAYLSFLVNDMGYAGFRYDMVKGFAASHVADYNDAAGVNFSVGEYWDGNSKIEQWIDDTQKKSAAFDYQFRYNVRDAINSADRRKLNTDNNLIHDADYRRYAVTFVENHDTEKRADADQDPIKADTLAANAYLLAMPGTPCVFFKHWQDYKQDIKAMIGVRKAAGIVNTSAYNNVRSNVSDFINIVEGTRARLAVRLVSYARIPDFDNSDFVQVLAGRHYVYYLSRSAETPWADKADGEYDEPFTATLAAVSADRGARLVYTLDGSDPTPAHGTQVSGGAQVYVDHSCTLKVGLLSGGKVTRVITRTYAVVPFNAYAIKVYVNADEAGWDTAKGLNFWTWGGDGSHAPANTKWPGDAVTATEQAGGKTWFVKSFTINSKNDYVDFVLSVGSGSPQTVNVENINQTSYITIQAGKDGSGNNTCTVTTPSASIAQPAVQPSAAGPAWYTLQGVRVQRPGRKGVYIHGGRKIVVK